MNLEKAIYSRLTGVEKLQAAALAAQAVIAGILATEPRTSLPAVYAGNHNQEGVKYPCVTFRANAGNSDSTIGAALPIDHNIVDFEVWDTSQSMSNIRAIDSAMALLLDDRCGCAPVLSGDGVVWDMRLFVPLTTTYDDRLHAWCGLLRYRFVCGR